MWNSLGLQSCSLSMISGCWDWKGCSWGSQSWVSCHRHRTATVPATGFSHWQWESSNKLSLRYHICAHVCPGWCFRITTWSEAILCLQQNKHQVPFLRRSSFPFLYQPWMIPCWPSSALSYKSMLPETVLPNWSCFLDPWLLKAALNCLER